MNRSSAVALAFSDADVGRGLGEYPDWPTRWQIKEIQDFARETGFPEDFHRLCLTPPNLDEEHHLVGNLEVPLNKRPNEKPVWCAICQTWKFGEGRLMWTPSEGAIRPIGHVCARGHFGEIRWRQMHEEADRRNKRERDEDFLIDTLPRVPTRIATLRRYEALAQALQTAHIQLFMKVPALGEALRRVAIEQNGALTVARKRERIAGGPTGLRTSTGASDYDTVTIATLRGLVFVTKTFRPLNALKSLVSELETLCIGDTGEAALEVVAELEAAEVSNWAKRLGSLLGRAERLEAKIADASGFLATETLPVSSRGLRTATAHALRMAKCADRTFGFENTVAHPTCCGLYPRSSGLSKKTPSANRNAIGPRL